jgi:hypothetical protein
MELPTHSVDVPAGTVADHLRSVVDLALVALAQVPEDAWGSYAGALEWDRWETVEHLADDLFSYALQLGPATPRLDSVVPVSWRRQRPGGPANAISVDRATGPAGLLEVLDACGALLAAMVRVTPASVRSHHVFGASDSVGFATMGIVEALVHTFDAVEGLGVPWSPPAGICTRALERLFPDVPDGHDPWRTLLWATGRADRPGRTGRTDWRWDGRPPAERSAP